MITISLTTEDDEDDDMVDDQSTSEWKLNLLNTLHYEKHGRKTGENLFILVHFLLKEFSMGKGKMRTGSSRRMVTTTLKF